MSYTNYNNNDQTFACHLRRYIGETVIIFTTSGGISGCGFTGVILSVSCDFVRLESRQGTAPACPLSGSCCGEFDDGNRGGTGCCGTSGGSSGRHFSIGSVCDIPIDSIAAFCHNAV